MTRTNHPIVTGMFRPSKFVFIVTHTIPVRMCPVDGRTTLKLVRFSGGTGGLKRVIEDEVSVFEGIECGKLGSFTSENGFVVIMDLLLSYRS